MTAGTEWITVEVTNLPPGWINVFREDNNKRHYPCPAILRQTSLAKNGGGTETRVIFADYDPDSGELYGVVDDWGSAANYSRTEYRPDLRPGDPYTEPGA